VRAFTLINDWRAREVAAYLPSARALRAGVLSALLHGGLLVILAFIIVKQETVRDALNLVAEPPPPVDPLTISEEFSAADLVHDEVGSTSAGNADASFVAAPTLSMTTILPTEPAPQEAPQISERVSIQEDIRLATGPRVSENLVV
jgi:hypothetical protein